jgi:hypothetical protein
LLEPSSNLSVNKETIRQVLKQDLGLVKKLATWVPRELTQDQKDIRFHIAQVNYNNYNNHPRILRKIIAIDETWVPF